MKKNLIIFLMISPLFLFGNMAKPYIDGSEPSTISGSENCMVINENIWIKLEKSEEDVFNAKYKIEYFIHSEIDQTIPLVFYGIGLSHFKELIVNNIKMKIHKIDKNSSYKLKFSAYDSIKVDSEDVVYFDAQLKKGQNKIVVEYVANLGYNTYGFVKEQTLLYSLFPSKFWKTFGKINIELTADEPIEIHSSNIGKPKIQNNAFKWEIKEITTDNIELTVTKRIGMMAKILLFINPLGMAMIALIALFLLHYKSIVVKYKENNRMFRFALSIGNFFVPVLFYTLYFLSFDLIDFSLNQTNSNHGYTFLFVFTLPIFWLVYGLVMWLIDRRLRNKHMPVIY